MIKLPIKLPTHKGITVTKRNMSEELFSFFQAVFLDLGGYEHCLDLHLVVKIYRYYSLLLGQCQKFMYLQEIGR